MSPVDQSEVERCIDFMEHNEDAGVICFEHLDIPGNSRALLSHYKFLIPEKTGKVFDYTFTPEHGYGIVAGKWLKGNVAFF